MNADDMIQTLLASAGAIMEDASACMILSPDDVPRRVSELRQVASELTTIANAVEATYRVGRPRQ